MDKCPLPAIDIYGFKGIVLVFLTLQLFISLYGAMKRIDHFLEAAGKYLAKRMITVVFAPLVPGLLPLPHHL